MLILDIILMSRYKTLFEYTLLRHTIDVLSQYLTEKVGQDLLCEGGCHRAELEGERKRERNQ